MENKIIVTEENRERLFNQIAFDPGLILDIKNPDLGMSFAAIRGDKSLLENIDENQKKALTNKFFIDNEVTLKEADSLLKTDTWSKVRTIKVGDFIIEGKLIFQKNHKGEYSVGIAQKVPHFDFDDDPVSKQIKNQNVRELLGEGKLVALKSDSIGAVRIYKLDKELNKIIEIPRNTINIPASVQEYNLTMHDLNSLLQGREINDIPFGAEKIGLKYDPEKNEMEPIFNKAAENAKVLSGNKEITKSEQKSAKNLLVHNKTNDFIKLVKEGKLSFSNEFLKDNIINNKNIPLADKFETLKAIGLTQKEMAALYTSKERAKPSSMPKVGIKEKVTSALKEVTGVVKSMSKSD